MQAIQQKAKQIKLAIFDVDGILTEGMLFYSDTGVQFKTFHVHDGLGLQLLKRSGVEVAIITSHDSSLISNRMQDLGIKYVYQGKKNKLPSYNDLLDVLKLTPEQVCYMGDDLPDLPLIRRSGLGITVPTAVALVKQHADWITTAQAGKGAVREACEMILHAQGTFDKVHQEYLE